jgi:predicted transposase/invertase (TIGR01784 family)
MKQRKPSERALISFDFALNQLLRNKAKYEVLEGFLSELLMCEIKVKYIGKNESKWEHPRENFNQVNVLVEDEKGEILFIDLRFAPERDFLHRMLHSVSKSLVERIGQSAKYPEIRKVYSINIVYFDLGQGDDYVYHGKTHFTGLHRHDELRLTPKQRETFDKEWTSDIYPEYYILKVNNFDDRVKDSLDEWVYFLKHRAIKEEFTAKGLRKVRKLLVRDKLSEEERIEYDYFLNMRSKDLSDISTAKDDGRYEGLEEARKEIRIEREKRAKVIEEEREKLVRNLEREREEREKLAKEYEAALAELARLRKTLEK